MRGYVQERVSVKTMRKEKWPYGKAPVKGSTLNSPRWHRVSPKAKRRRRTATAARRRNWRAR